MSHVIETDLASFVRLFFDEAFNHALFVGFLKFKVHRVLDVSEQRDGTIRRRVETAVPVDLPPLLQGLVGESQLFIEDGIWDPTGLCYTVDLNPRADIRPLRMRMQMKLSFVPVAPKQTLRKVDASAEVSAFGFGAAMEQLFIRRAQQMYERAAQFSNQWIREHQL